MDHLEIELKFLLSDFTGLHPRFRDLGAVCVVPNTFEHNVRYETADERLLKGNCLLRLRKDRDTTLTFKAPPPDSDSRFKTYRELEVRVEDFDAMDAILRALGFVRRQVYEKWRETWRLDEVTLCLDTMPYGCFLEIEGAPDPIMKMVGALDLRWDRRILASYLGMFALLKEKESLSFSDVTFDNFNGLHLAIDRYRDLFEAGRDGGN